MTRRWHCLACNVEWWTTDPTCWSCGGQGRAGGVEPERKKSPSELACEQAWRLASGLGSAPIVPAPTQPPRREPCVDPAT